MNVSLLEICVLCGFVHRDDRTQTRQRKPHYHWAPEAGEEIVQGNTIHATVCISCVESPIQWLGYATARKDTNEKYYIPDSYNASLPFLPTSLLASQYHELCIALKSDSARW